MLTTGYWRAGAEQHDRLARQPRTSTSTASSTSSPSTRCADARPEVTAALRHRRHHPVDIKVRLDCLLVHRSRCAGDQRQGDRRRACRRRSAPAPCGSACSRPRSSAWSSTAGAARRPRWSPSAPASAAAPSCTTSRPRTTSSSPPSSTSASSAARSCARRRATCRAASGAPAPCWRCSPTTSPARCSPPPSSCGSPRAPTRRCTLAVVPLEQRVGREAHRIAVDAARRRRVASRGVRELVQATLDLVRGLGLANTITDDTARRGRILDGLGAHPRRRAEGMPMTDRAATRCSPTSPPRATRSRRWCAARRGRAGVRRPRRPAGTSRTQVAHLAWTDEVAVAAATDKEAWDARRARGDRRPRRASSTPRRSTAAKAVARPSCSTAGARRAPAWQRGAARATRPGRRCRGSARR